MADDMQMVQAPDTTKTIIIRPPISFKGGTFDMLVLREPMSGEVRKAEGQMRNNLSNEGLRLMNTHLISMVSGWPVPVIEQIRISDFNEAAAYLQNFIEAGLGTGKI